MEAGFLNEISYNLSNKIILYNSNELGENFRAFVLNYGDKGFITVDELREFIPEQYFYNDDKEFDYNKLEIIISILLRENIKLLTSAFSQENLLDGRKEIIAKFIMNNTKILAKDLFSLYLRDIKKLSLLDSKEENYFDNSAIDDKKNANKQNQSLINQVEQVKQTEQIEQIENNVELKLSLKEKILLFIKEKFKQIFNKFNKLKDKKIEIIKKNNFESKANLDEFKKLLLDLKQEMLIQAKDTFKDSYEIVHTCADLNDVATALEEIERNSNIQTRNLFLLEEINQALLRIETKTFGYCTECGEEINLERLKIIPTAQLCLDCQKLKERYLKNYQAK